MKTDVKKSNCNYPSLFFPESVIDVKLYLKFFGDFACLIVAVGDDKSKKALIFNFFVFFFCIFFFVSVRRKF